MILPFAWGALVKHRHLFAEQWKLICLNAFLAMGVCGTGVYLGLKYTSATNGTLIYTASPVLIIIIEWLYRGRPISLREITGILVAVLGIFYIIFKGRLDALWSVEFNSGDLLFVIAAICWAIYSTLSKKRVFQPVSTVGMFAVVAGVGAAIQVPFMTWEIVTLGNFPVQADQWISLFGLALISSILAFTTYQYGIKILGPATSGVFMYLMTPIGVVLAVVFLGEDFLPFHAIGLILVMTGVVLATFPVHLFARHSKQA